MNSLLQKFLTDTEESGLPEGEYLLVANALKKVFQEVEPLQSKPLTLKIEGKGGKEFSLVFKTATKKDRDVSCHYSLSIGEKHHPLLTIEACWASCMVEKLLFFCSTDSVVITTGSIKTTISIDSTNIFFKYLEDSEMRNLLPREYNTVSSIVEKELESIDF